MDRKWTLVKSLVIVIDANAPKVDAHSGKVSIIWLHLKHHYTRDSRQVTSTPPSTDQ